MDQEKIKHIIITLLVCLTIVAVCAGIIYLCMDNNNRWYIAQHDCIANGGSWIPQSNLAPLCIHGNEVKP
jgi:hypothetical protein